MSQLSKTPNFCLPDPIVPPLAVTHPVNWLNFEAMSQISTNKTWQLAQLGLVVRSQRLAGWLAHRQHCRLSNFSEKQNKLQFKLASKKYIWTVFNHPNGQGAIYSYLYLYLYFSCICNFRVTVNIRIWPLLQILETAPADPQEWPFKMWPLLQIRVSDNSKCDHSGRNPHGW